ncbi:MAG: pyruvate kinase [Candidatus Thermoplasmatota archaeon]|nr:pyruvate kinase [Candidatus Thermoplasmatota archaeon]
MRRTRIVATVGPACDSIEQLSLLIDAGADVFRLNYSHDQPEDKTVIYERIRQLENEKERPIAILADLPGPKLRLGSFPGVIQLRPGETLRLHCGTSKMSNPSPSDLPVDYDALPSEISIGDPILLADGLIRLKVVDTDSNMIHCTIEDGGPVSSRKGVNVPGTIIDLPAIGPRDEAALNHALQNGADYIAVSYVRSVEDLKPARDTISLHNQHVPVIAKIEHPAALDNLDDILDYADAVMVARGDLGVEIPLESVPMAQQKIIDAGLSRGQPVIVATQMLESMTINPRPTRAEVSDVSTAIRHGATAVMLSGETASGDHPILAVETMAKIAQSSEESWTYEEGRPTSSEFRTTRAVAHAGVELARECGAVRIIVATEHGNAPRLVSGYRPGMPVTAVTDRVRAARRTCLLPGVDSVLVEEKTRGSETMLGALKVLAERGDIMQGDLVVSISGSPLAMRGATSTARLYRVGEGGQIHSSES